MKAIDKFKALTEILEKSDNENSVILGSGISVEVIKDIESKLDITLPPSYKDFLKIFAEAGFGSYDIAGYPANPEITLEIREICLEDDAISFPNNFVIIYSLGDGTEFCIDTRKKSQNERPIVAWPNYNAKQPYEVISKSFGDFLLETLWGWIINNNITTHQMEKYKPIQCPWNIEKTLWEKNFS